MPSEEPSSESPTPMSTSRVNTGSSTVSHTALLRKAWPRMRISQTQAHWKSAPSSRASDMPLGSPTSGARCKMSL